MKKNLNLYYIIAAFFSLLIFLAHSLVGETDIGQPLLQMENLSDEIKYGLYYCWHIVTLALILLSGSFIYCAFNNDNMALAVTTTIYAGLIAALGVGMALIVGASFEDFGQGYLFIPVTLFGCIGIYKARRLGIQDRQKDDQSQMAYSN